MAFFNFFKVHQINILWHLGVTHDRLIYTTNCFYIFIRSSITEILTTLGEIEQCNNDLNSTTAKQTNLVAILSDLTTIRNDLNGKANSDDTNTAIGRIQDNINKYIYVTAKVWASTGQGILQFDVMEGNMTFDENGKLRIPTSRLYFISFNLMKVHSGYAGGASWQMGKLFVNRIPG